jgi:hypothetical protein
MEAGKELAVVNSAGVVRYGRHGGGEAWRSGLRPGGQG